MLKRLASQMNLMSTSPSSEISDQCFFESSLTPETGSACQSGGNPVLRNRCEKYLISPFRIRSASSTVSWGFHGTLSGKVACSKKNAGEFCLRQRAYASGFEGMFFFNHVSSGRSSQEYDGICTRTNPVRSRNA